MNENTPERRIGHVSKGTWFIVLLLSVAFLIVLPYLVNPRNVSAANTCVANLKQLDGAKEQWGLENRKTTNDIPTWNDLIGKELYIKSTPRCPDKGVYLLNRVGQEPSCSKGETNELHALPR